MKTQEQLQLDFSARDDTEGAQASASAVIYRLDLFRSSETVTKSSLSAVYDAIYDTVKHVSVGRRPNPQQSTDSSFS